MCQMTEITCCVCHVKHSIPLDLYNGKGEWTCPNGHELIRSTKKTEVQTLKTELERVKRESEIWRKESEARGKEIRELESSIATKVATRTEVKRLKKKINAYKSTLKRMSR